VFPLIIVFPIDTHMHHVLLGRGGVFFGVGSFCVRCYGSGPTKGWCFFFSSKDREVFSLVLSRGPLERENNSFSKTRIAGG
jgi:hypothetical protein